MDPQEFCPQCHTPVTLQDNFCPHCGNDLRRNISTGRQIWIYFVSLLLPPFGLIYTFKYLFSDSSQKKRVAIIAASITIISIVVTVWFTMRFFNTVNQQVQQQLAPYQNSGL